MKRSVGYSLLIRSILAVGLLQLLIFPFPNIAYSQTSQPNFIVIVADDLGYGDLGIYGAEEIKTPNLDLLASEGVRFTSFYSNSTICTPTRAALLTGRHPSRVGVDNGIPLTGPDSKKGLPGTEVTLPEVLSQEGYATAIIGKWHLGHQDQFNPTLHGFDTWFGVPYSNDFNNGDIPLYRDTEIIENPVDQHYLTQRYTQEALAFIDQNSTTPFFLYLPHTAPHIPLHVSPEFEGVSEGGLYGDAVEEIDWSVGQILAELKDLGIEDNTLVIFTSDNGPWTYQEENGGDQGPFSCGKGSFFEGGVRVPFIARWPGQITSGRLVDALAVTFDLFPTLINLAGAPLPEDRVIDGQDISGLLSGAGQRNEDEVVFSLDQKMRGIRADEWKLLLEYPGGPDWMDECGSAPHPLLLFNILSDPGETTNLAAEFPELVNYLQGEISAFEESLAHPDNQPPVADFGSLPVGVSVHFEADASFDIDGSLVSYEWDFGDGATASGVEVNHTYTTFGKYIVTLTVEDNEGLRDGKIKSIQVGGTFLPLIISKPVPF
jgi:arylsulfatase A-like enzyme